MSRLQLAIDQITFARNYTIRFLDHIKVDDWFRQPAGGVTHISPGKWATGRSRSTGWRWTGIRGAQPEDDKLISQHFLKLFGKESVPAADPNKYPSPEAIRVVFDRVHQQTLEELQRLPDATLDEPVERPHSLVKTKLWALLWCAQHEAVHAGQIGLIRRQLSYPPIW